MQNEKKYGGKKLHTDNQIYKNEQTCKLSVRPNKIICKL